MAKITKSIIIDTPVEKVFEYLSDPENMMEWHPSVTNIRDITGRGEQQRWRWDYKLFGHVFSGEVQVTSSIINKERIIKSTGGIKSTRTWKFRSEAGGTRLGYELEYTIPASIIGKFGELLALMRSERVVEMAMANIKEMMEALSA